MFRKDMIMTEESGLGSMEQNLMFRKNNKMKKFSEPKKRMLTHANIGQMKSVNRFCNILLHTIVQKNYRPSNKRDPQPNFLSAAEKLWYVERFLENKIETNNTLIKMCEEELVKTHIPNYWKKKEEEDNDI
tara:strand:- start:784 stop:1176 length:393 start_codon:yes stop_codon:yes gene_type:complete